MISNKECNVLLFLQQEEIIISSQGNCNEITSSFICRKLVGNIDTFSGTAALSKYFLVPF